eukprot:TRINITY_DN813_c0_g2_i6.p1 TRINITY_DN813_c0_g2~~TRINITY_DN813_c0_g2_i6.p1  ORF type:complete len:125 (-),score=2.90 TRINITY_DN813_c0_g2_i6:11-385(-)
MKTSSDGHNTENVIDLFTGKPYSSQFDKRFIRLAPELDGLEMLYSNEVSGDKYFSLKVLCWALRADGEVVGLVPWLDDIIACPDIKDPLNVFDICQKGKIVLNINYQQIDRIYLEFFYLSRLLY